MVLTMKIHKIPTLTHVCWMTILLLLDRPVQGIPAIMDYPDCYVRERLRLGDGVCDGGQYNTAACGWDGGDCVGFNTKYPNCTVPHPYLLLGDDICYGGGYNTAECGWSGGSCAEFNERNADFAERYPDCHISQYLDRLGDGKCDGGDYNTPECGWDGGDCVAANAALWAVYPDCRVRYPESVGDGECDGKNTCWHFDYHHCIIDDYNTAECGWDGGDCPPPAAYPDCHAD